MRTTLDIADDVLSAVREISQVKSQSMGEVVSELVREALTPRTRPRVRHGFPQFPGRRGSRIVTMELVNRLRDEMD